MTKWNRTWLKEEIKGWLEVGVMVCFLLLLLGLVVGLFMGIFGYWSCSPVPCGGS